MYIEMGNLLKMASENDEGKNRDYSISGFNFKASLHLQTLESVPRDFLLTLYSSLKYL